MLRKLVLAVVILAMAAVPVPALAEGRHGFHGGPGFHGGREFRGGPRFGHFHRPFGFYPYPYYAPYYGYVPYACYWQPGYSVTQPYVDRWGHQTNVQQWVPARRVCS